MSCKCCDSSTRIIQNNADNASDIEFSKKIIEKGSKRERIDHRQPDNHRSNVYSGNFVMGIEGGRGQNTGKNISDRW